MGDEARTIIQGANHGGQWGLGFLPEGYGPLNDFQKMCTMMRLALLGCPLGNGLEGYQTVCSPDGRL